jgi:Zn ribbon nucleic-acid-binding protein
VKDLALKQTPTGGHGKSGKYLTVSLVAQDGSRKRHYVHVLMLETFVGPRPFARAESRHLDDDGKNNRIENLVWGTQSENNDDRVNNGIHHYAKRIQCSNGHDFDGFNGKQRTCSECRRERGRKRRAAKKTCPQGHSFDGVRLNKDGSVRQRYCTRCAHDALDRGRQTRWAKQ